MALLDVAKLLMAVLVGAQEKAKGGDSASRVATGTTVGEKSAAAVLAIRANDKSNTNHQSDANCKAGPLLLRGQLSITPARCPQGDRLERRPGFEAAGKIGFRLVERFPLRVRFRGGRHRHRHQAVVRKDAGVPKAAQSEIHRQPEERNVGQAADPHGGVKPMADMPANQGTLDLYVYGSVTQVPNGPAKMVPSAYSVQAYGGLAVPADVPLAFPPGQGDRFLTPTKRTQAQTVFAQFWGYDGVALLCAPPRLYNMIATSTALDHVVDGKGPRTGVAMARYLALTNMALADAAIAAWGGKYRYKIARPVTYLRAKNGSNDPNWVPSKWTPFGQVATNGQPLGTTPPFPAYPSGHATFGGAFFEMVAHLLGVRKDAVASKFDFVSDEYNGEMFGADGRARPFMKVHYASLKGVEWENAESRIFLGVHWQQDGDDGIALGNDIADRIFATTLKKLH